MTETFTIAWRYLTGYARATDAANREAAEWPPHPARVWLALAAAFFETGEDPQEGAALEWLTTLPDPQLWLPADAGGRRRVTTAYVPINDRVEGTALLQSVPLARSKQPRVFPTVWVGDAPCFLHWPEAPKSAIYADALARLCAKVTRLGHSASLVQMWTPTAPPHLADGFVCWLPEPDDADGRPAPSGLADGRLRRIRNGPSLDRLRDTFQAGRRPTVGLATDYVVQRAAVGMSPPEKTEAFDQDVLVLAQTDGPALPVTAALMVTQALRATLLSRCPQPPPAWLSGHDPDGKPLTNGRRHIALLPLPFVGREHADGRLLGVALAFPPDVPRRERGRALAPVLVDAEGQPAEVALKLGRLGVWTLRKRAWDDARATLRPETWTAAPRGATTWASVTPVVLDRFPKAHLVKERAAWEMEVGALIFEACRHAGLPEPVEIDFGATSWQRGTPRAVAKARPLRGQPNAPTTQARLGDGFPPYFAKGANAPKPQLHVFLRFAGPVVGPVLLGAGRFMGYGLFKPLQR
ncbi:MAG: type I-U CRISPR-associated protein Csb2 [Chloracidobacterium sp.]|nr:type I-U CRISPR-associated protein Csb2 [Chloracidobacterium sp.]MDW8216799.1 type I-U CRISPR-associated protein Csb2 [Acidobacteriota bacterium]